MKEEDFLNYKNVSLFLSGNDNSIRRNQVPKKYANRIQELRSKIKNWMDNEKSNN